MKTGKFLCVGWVPILLCSLVLALITFAFEWREIEYKVNQSASSVLSDPEFSWATVETHNKGRQVVITGAAPSTDSIRRAEASVGQALGVLAVFHNGEPLAKQPPVPPTLFAESKAGKITLRGKLSNQDDVDLALASARRAFGQQATINELSVSDNIKPLSDFNFLSALYLGNNNTGSENLEAEPNSTLTAELKQGVLSLSGFVPTQAKAAALDTRIRSLFNGDVDNQVSVISPIVKLDSCADSVDEVLSRGKINFETGNATIAESSLSLLQEIAAIAERCPEASFEVAGHTDNTGNLDFNRKLSKQRAQSVVNYLVDQGLPAEQFSASGYGPQRPIADNQTAQGRAQNRRIEFKLSN